MLSIQEDLARRIDTLEKELKTAIERNEQEFRYRWAKGRATFEKDALSGHRKLKSGLASYLLHSRMLPVLTAPVIYLGIIPFALLDLFLLIFQTLCFPAYGIPRVRRSDYLIFDRGNLKYLNLLERVNCAYCSYANGLTAYLAEVAARMEQHWCPIKHALRIRSPHSRYSRFFDYGNAADYRRRLDAVRSDFVDLRTLTSSSGPAKGMPRDGK